MARKDDNKRKPQQGKTKPASKDKTGLDIVTLGRAAGPPLVKPSAAERAAAPDARGSKKGSSDSKKKNKKR